MRSEALRSTATAERCQAIPSEAKQRRSKAAHGRAVRGSSTAMLSGAKALHSMAQHGDAQQRQGQSRHSNGKAWCRRVSPRLAKAKRSGAEQWKGEAMRSEGVAEHGMAKALPRRAGQGNGEEQRGAEKNSKGKATVDRRLKSVKKKGRHMRNVTTYLMEHSDEFSRFGKRLAEAVAVCGGALTTHVECTGQRPVHPKGWENVIKANARIWFNGQFTDEDVATVRDGCLAIATRCEVLIDSCYWPQELVESKRLAIDRLREEVSAMVTTFNQESPD